MGTERPPRRWRKGAIALAAFVLVSLGVGPQVVDYYFDDAVDSIADQLGSVEVRATPMAGGDPLFMQSWAFAEPDALGAGPVPESAAVAELGIRAARVGGMTGVFVVESNRANDLLITEMRVRVLRSSEPLGGTLVYPRVGGGPSDEQVVRARFRVGGPDPRAFDGRDPDRLLFGDSKLRLRRGDSMVLEVTGVAAADCYCEWVVDIDLAIGSEIRTVTVPDEDHPLRLTAPVRRYGSVYQAWAGGDDLTVEDPATICAGGDCLAYPPP